VSCLFCLSVPILPALPAQPPHYQLYEKERIKPSYDGVAQGTPVPHHPDMDYVEPTYEPAKHLALSVSVTLTTFDFEEVASMPPVKGNEPSNLAYTSSFRVLSDEGVKVLRLILKKYDALKVSSGTGSDCAEPAQTPPAAAARAMSSSRRLLRD
jgi:hypothetical protein